MNSSLCFDPGSLDQQVARGKTSPVNGSRNFSYESQTTSDQGERENIGINK
tara:strand:+ start:270 stop:422 length:153 start_codon:yes stop_codon:yes gene_type:complete